MSQPTAAMLIIGNEILSGRTQDKNLNYVATKLTELGITLVEARVIADVEQSIIDAVRELSDTYDYVFTSGGIGPTHDDITSPSIAKAFGVEWVLSEEIKRRLEKHYEGTGTEVNEARMRMAYIPEGASLIDNPVSSAPGFVIKNVHVMAGVPKIMQSMMDGIVPTLRGGDKVESRSVVTYITEGDMAAFVGTLEETYRAKGVAMDVGSYPFMKHGRLGTSIVIRSADVKALEAAEEEMRNYVMSLGGELDDAHGERGDD